MKNTKFDIRIFVLSLIVFFGFGVLYIRANTMPVFKYDYVSINRNDFITIMGYEIEGNHFKDVSADPKMILTTQAYEDVQGVRIVFEGEKVPGEVQAYFKGEDEEFSEFNSIYVYSGPEKYIEIEFPKVTQMMSLDINDEFILEDIQFLVNKTLVNEGIDLWKYIVALCVALLISVITAFIPIMTRTCDNAVRRLKDVISSICHHKKLALIYILIVALIGILSILIEYVVVEILDYDYFKKYEALMIFVAGFIAFAAFVLRKITAEKPQYLFLVIVLSLGCFNIISSPKFVGISWDDEIHYGRTVYFSYGAGEQIPYADAKMISMYADIIENNHDYYDKDNRKQVLDELAVYAADGVMVDTNDYSVNLSYITNIVPSMGLIIGRGLGLGYGNTFMLGKFMNLLFYSLIFYKAISLIKKRGKYLLCVFGLIPTLVFLASSYSYDGWVVSLAVLGYAILISELQKPEESISLKKWIGIMAIMVLAFIPKAVYFPIIFPMLFIGKKKFSEKHKFNKYVLLNIVAMLLLLSTFIIPLFVSGPGSGDARGGEGIDSTAQMAFIFGKPLEYTGILLSFLGKYFSLNQSNKYLTFLGYYGMASHFTVCIAVFAAVACLDNRSDHNKQGKGFKAMLLFSAFATVCLVATALYISFTPVGYYTVNGCQWRYLLPILFPVLYFMSELRISTTKLNRSLMASLAMIIMALVFLNGIGTLCIRYY